MAVGSAVIASPFIITGQFVNTLKIFIEVEDLTVSYNHHLNIEGIQGDPSKQLFSKIVIPINRKILYFFFPSCQPNQKSRYCFTIKLIVSKTQINN